MAMSDNLVRNKMLEVERERLEVEKVRNKIEMEKTKVLADIRDIMIMNNAMFGLEIETKAKNASYNPDDVKKLGENIAGVKKFMEERWSE